MTSTQMPMGTSGREPCALLALALAGLALSGFAPADRLTWLLEVAPILIGAPILVLTWRRFPLTLLLYRLFFLHAIILMIGGHYTYAMAPPGEWVREAFDLERNHFDRLGHFAQGFVPAILARELLLRCTPLTRGGWLMLLVTCGCLAFSAFYELIEWWSALAFGQAADAFLGTQGDPWDTQWDMFLALIGATSAQITLGRLHDKHMKQVACSTPAAKPQSPPATS